MKKIRIEFIVRTGAEETERILGKILEYIRSWNTSSTMTREGLREVKFAEGPRVSMEELQ